MGNTFLDFGLEQQQGWNNDEKNSKGRGDKAIYARAVERAQVFEQTHAEDGPRHAAGSESQHDDPADRAAPKMDPTGADLGHEVEQGVGTNSNDRGHPQDENQDRQQKHAAPNSRHADESSYQETDRDFSPHEHSALPLSRVGPL